MARPVKQGIDYFPMDVDFMQDIKIRRIVRSCGPESIAVLVRILSDIYRDEGYYIKWGPEVAFWVADDLDMSEEKVTEIVKESLRSGFFNENLFVQYQVLTSAGIQSRFLSAVTRRKSIEFWVNVSLISPNDYNNLIVVDNNGVNVSINQVNDDRSTQSKVKESKVEESRVKNTSSTEPSKDASMQESVFIKLPLNDGTEHPVTEKDLKRYIELYPAVDVRQDLRNMVGWLEANPSKRKTKKGVRRFITNWLARTQDSGGSKSKGNGQSSSAPTPGGMWQGKPDNRYFLPEEDRRRLDTFISEDVAKKQDAYRKWLQPHVKAQEEALGRKLNKVEEKEIIHKYADEFIAFYEAQQNGGGQA